MNPEQSHDERLDRLLRALGSPETEDGLPKRMLRQIENRSATGKRAAPSSRTGGWAWTLTAASMCAVLLAFALRAPSRKDGVASLAVKSVGVARAAREAPPRLGVNRERREPLKVSDEPPRVHVAPAPVAQAPVPPGAAGLASFPAPPLPLTEQERLLLKVIHRGDPEEIAMLDPVVRAGEHAADVAEFQEFFKPPPLSPESEAEVAITKAKGESQ